MALILVFLSIFVWVAFIAYIVGRNITMRIDRLENEILQRINFMEMKLSKQEQID